MKRVEISAMQWLGITMLLLITVTIFTALNLAFSLLFYVTVLGQGLLVFTVVKVLKEDYTTDKTFADFYEDRPINNT